MPRKLTPQEVKEVLSLKKEDITSKKLKDFFAIYMGKDAPRFNTNDRFVLLKNDYYRNYVETNSNGTHYYMAFKNIIRKDI